MPAVSREEAVKNTECSQAAGRQAAAERPKELPKNQTVKTTAPRAAVHKSQYVVILLYIQWWGLRNDFFGEEISRWV